MRFGVHADLLQSPTGIQPPKRRRVAGKLPTGGRMSRVAATLMTGMLLVVPAWAQQGFPPPNSTVQTSRPSIGYDFRDLVILNPRIILDGQDVGRLQTNGTRVQFQPMYDLAPGVHNVQATAVNQFGKRVGNQWQFTIMSNQPPVPPVSSTPRVTPAHESVVAEARPRLQADFPEQLRSARLWLDGNEQTSMVILSGNTLSYAPSQDLARGRHQASAQVLLASGRTENYSWTFDVQPPAAPPPSQAFLNLSPPRSANMKTRRPYIAADFAPDVRDVRLVVDNQDVTNQAERTNQRIAWTPTQGLGPGQHRARVEGRLPNGQFTATEWDFTVESSGRGQGNTPPPAAVDFTVDQPLNADRVSNVFEVHGSAAPGAAIRIVVRPLPRKNKVVNFKGTADRAGYFVVPVSASWAPRGQRLEVQVTAVDAQSGRKLAEPYTIEVYRR
jgi:hypothetical protein